MKVLYFCLIIVSLAGCAESSFELALESRLPKWFDTPKGKLRTNFKITMDYYTKPSGRTAKIKMIDESGKTLQKVKGTLLGGRPIELKSSLEGLSKEYPSYEIITVNGIADIVEHRKMEPIFYMSDAPAVWKLVNK